jgi:acetyl esterase/lipase
VTGLPGSLDSGLRAKRLGDATVDVERDRFVDPRMGRQLTRFRELVGPQGFHGLDLSARRARYGAILAGAAPHLPKTQGVQRSDHRVPGADGAPRVPVRVYRPEVSSPVLPAVLYLHGGGQIMGSVDGEDSEAAALAGAIGCVVVSVEYRLSPENPAPCAMLDAFAALIWLREQVFIDSSRLAAYGSSAGGGLAAALAIYCRERGERPFELQMLLAPMLDDRTGLNDNSPVCDVGVWDAADNRQAWSMALSGRAGAIDLSPLLAPARNANFNNLPPTYVDVGSTDLFFAESLSYASRLGQAGVPVELHVYPGAYHSFDQIARRSDTSIAARQSRHRALSRALFPETPNQDRHLVNS